MDRLFTRFANWAAAIAGHRLAFVTALTLILAWAISGPIFGFSDTWQLVINTVTTIITFLMVFLIQNTQNRDAMAMHLKLDEIIKALKEADNRVMLAEDETVGDLVKLKEQYAALSAKHRDLAEDHLELSQEHEELAEEHEDLAEAHQFISAKHRHAAK